MDFLLLYQNEKGHYDVVYRCDEEESEDLINEFNHFQTFNGMEKSALFVYSLTDSLKGMPYEA